MITKEIEKYSNSAMNKTFTYCLHCNIFALCTYYFPLTLKHTAPQYTHQSTLVGLPLLEIYDILKHAKNFIFNVLYTGYMYTYTQRKIYHVYILEYNLGDME